MRRVSLFLLVAPMVLACTDTVIQPNPAMELAVNFGTEPSPFFPSATNELEAVVQHLGVVRDQVGSLCWSEDRCRPDPAVIGQLGAMTSELSAINGQVMAVLDVPNDPTMPGLGELGAAARQVYAAAGFVAEDAGDAIEGFEPTPFLVAAFGAVIDASGVIRTSVLQSEFCDVAGANPCGLVLPN